MIRIKSEFAFLLLLSFAWSPQVIGLFLKVFIGKVLGNPELGQLVMVIIIVILVLLSIKYFVSNLKFRDYFIFFVMLMTYIYYMYNSIVQYYLVEKVNYIIFQCLSMVLIGTSLKSEHIEWLHKVSIAAISALVIYIFTFGKETYSEQAMAHSYAMLTYTCLIYYYYIVKNNKIDLIFLIIGYSLILFMGSRGPFILLNLFLISGIILFSQKNYRNKFIRLVFIFIVSLIIYLLFDQILELSLNLSNDLGLSSRVLEKMTDRTVFQDDGRNDIYESMITALKSRLWTGYGLAGDRYLIDSYSHNIFIELIISFGIIIGPILILILLITIVKSFYKQRLNPKGIILLVLLFSGGFFKLIWSGSYLTEPYFFLMIGLMLNMLKRKRNFQNRILLPTGSKTILNT